MSHRMTLFAAAAIVLLAGVACQPPDDLWFEGDFPAAAARAKETDTLVMLDFYTDWCSWCRRLEEDTFADTEVRKRLRELVPMRINAEKGGEELAERFSVNGYPTLVFVNAAGREVDRLVGYFPPDSFLSEVERIRSGDTFTACLGRLDADPTDLEALQRSVDELLERADPAAAIARVEAFHRVTADAEHPACRRLLFAARAALLDREYDKAARHYRRGSTAALELADTVGTAQLFELAASDRFSPADPVDQAAALREARHADADALLQTVPYEHLAPSELVEVADFAYANGHFDLAGELYRSWFAANGEMADAADLNRIAWRLYLMQRELDTALEMARRAHQLAPSPDVADTLARLLYLAGEVDEAIEVELRAAEAADDAHAAAFRDAVAIMQGRGSFDDRPSFASFPGDLD